MQSKYNKTEHFNKAGESLKALKPNVSAQDRKEAVAELKISDVTIGSYLSGVVRDLSTAERLILFFSAAVERRNKLFTQTLAAVSGE